MDEECCVMEEKSILACLYAARKNEDIEMEEKNSWLPDGLKRRMAQSSSTIQNQLNYPILDWLKEIRTSCALYDVGLPVKDNPKEEDTWSNKASSDIDDHKDTQQTLSSHVQERNVPDIVEYMNVLYATDNADSEIAEDEEEEEEDLYENIDNSWKELKETEVGAVDETIDNNGSTWKEIEEIEAVTSLLDSVLEEETEDEDSSQKDENAWSEIEAVTSLLDSVLESEESDDSWRLEESEAIPSLMGSKLNNLPTACCFSLGSEGTKCIGFRLNNSVQLSRILFCSDDVGTLKYCERLLRQGKELSDEFDRFQRSLEESSRVSNSSDDFVDSYAVDDDSILTLDSLEENLAKVDESIVENRSALVNSEETADWAQERFDESDRINGGSDDDERTRNRFGTVDGCEEDYSRDDTKPVMRWVAAFNNFNALKESAQVDRRPVDTFNVFDGINDNAVEEVSRELDENAGAGECERVALGISIGQNENIKECRSRKGSVSSDIVMWKKSLLDTVLDDEECMNEWFSSNDAEGKIYFFEENSNESSWVLPTGSTDKSHSISADVKSGKEDSNVSSPSEKAETAYPSEPNLSVGNRELAMKKAGPAGGGDWPHLCDGNNMLVLKEGIINRTKITENGKKLRKNWSTSYAVLTELFLLFFKDAKTFTMMKTGQSSMAKPDISVDLNGALVEPGDRASSRKNVYMISTVLGLQVLVQSDNTAVATEWFQEIHGAIRKLPSGFHYQGKPLAVPPENRKTSGGKQPTDSNLLDDPKRSSKIARSRSMKMKRLDDSLEDLNGSAAERQTKIKAKLRRFFQRRPAVELLKKNGIYKNEPAFGSYLSDVCPTEPPRVPLFVKTCIEVLESKEENMKTDGLYRASGNLSQIQKIRLQVDQYKLDVLAQEEDVHVLTGALKLFFRELKEPLIPSTFFAEAVNASMLKKSSTKIQCFRDIVKALPPPNYDTLQFLLKHLLRVTSYQEFNRMHIPNLAIVFGPTLMWPAEESANMALDFMQQNLVIECLLSEYNKIFK